jgi:hypothetical protein
MASPWLLASGCWLLVTESKILGMNRDFSNLSACNRKLATAIQEKETSSLRPVTSSLTHKKNRKGCPFRFFVYTLLPEL